MTAPPPAATQTIRATTSVGRGPTSKSREFAVCYKSGCLLCDQGESGENTDARDAPACFSVGGWCGFGELPYLGGGWLGVRGELRSPR